MGRTGRTTIQGKYGDTLKIVAVDTDGQIVSVIKGTDASGNIVTILVDAAGKMLAVMQGDYAGTPKTLAVDPDGRMQAILYGTYGTTPTAIAVDAGGKLVVQNLAQTNIEGDLTEAQTYDSPVSNLLNNMNRIRNQIIAITGEAWGTVTRSTLTIWAKFHATTGHKHTGAADDSPNLAGTSVTNTPAGTIAATTVQAALNELDTEKETPAGAQTKVDTHVNDATDAHAGSAITNTPAGTIAATTVQAALNELDTEKLAKSGDTDLAVADGGTGRSVTVAYTPVCGGTTITAAHQSVASIGSAGQVLTSNGAAALPTFQTISGIPSGMIAMWHGLIANIPTGYVLCDGANGTPDLRSKFVRGAPAATEPGGTGGADTHTLTLAESPAHAHGSLYTDGVTENAAGIPALTSYNGIAPFPWSPCVASAGSGNAHNNMPAYYQILFIMKT